MRTLVLLIFTKAYSSNNVNDYIAGFQMFMLNFSSLRASNLPGLKQTIGWMNSPQSDSTFEQVGLKSKSAVVNLENLLFMVVLLVLLNLL